MTDSKFQDEAARQRATERCEILDTPREVAFDRITSLVRRVLRTPMAALSFIDKDRSWAKSFDGLEGATGTGFPRRHSFCDHLVKLDGPLIVSNTAEDARFCDNPYIVGDPFIASYLGFPVRSSDGYNVGALCAMDTTPRAFTSDDIDNLQEMAELAGEHLAARRIATQDHLTGALTRRSFHEAMSLEIARHLRYRRDAALLILDIDHFKQVNDTYGHPVGDEVIRAVADCCIGMVRPNDQFGRLGGEEFAILLTESDARAALAVADRFRKAIEALSIGALGLRVTASFGVATLKGGAASDVEGWLAAADLALYEAKRAGRNVCRLSLAA